MSQPKQRTKASPVKTAFCLDLIDYFLMTMIPASEL